MPGRDGHMLVTVDLEADGICEDWAAGRRKTVLTIAVAVHVVYRRDEENISNAQISSQIRALNRDFRAKNPDIA